MTVLRTIIWGITAWRRWELAERERLSELPIGFHPQWRIIVYETQIRADYYWRKATGNLREWQK